MPEYYEPLTKPPLPLELADLVASNNGDLWDAIGDWAEAKGDAGYAAAEKVEEAVVALLLRRDVQWGRYVFQVQMQKPGGDLGPGQAELFIRQEHKGKDLLASYRLLPSQLAEPVCVEFSIKAMLGTLKDYTDLLAKG